MIIRICHGTNPGPTHGFCAHSAKTSRVAVSKEMKKACGKECATNTRHADEAALCQSGRDAMESKRKGVLAHEKLSENHMGLFGWIGYIDYHPVAQGTRCRLQSELHVRGCGTGDRARGGGIAGIPDGSASHNARGGLMHTEKRCGQKCASVRIFFERWRLCALLLPGKHLHHLCHGIAVCT